MKYESFLPQAQVVISKKMYDIVDAVVKNTERVVKQTFMDFPKPPILSGNLRRNITGKVISQNAREVVGEIRASTPLLVGRGKGKKAKGGKLVEYAVYVELGTAKMPPRPFMRRGVAKALKSNEAIIKRLGN